VGRYLDILDGRGDALSHAAMIVSCECPIRDRSVRACDKRDISDKRGHGPRVRSLLSLMSHGDVSALVAIGTSKSLDERGIFPIEEVDDCVDVPTEWTQGCARLMTMPRPKSIGRRDWEAMTRAANSVLRRWGRQLAAFGWTTADVFGVHPTKTMERYDHAGLIRYLVDGSDVVVVTADHAVVRRRGGSPLKYYRRDNRESARPHWDLE
jgi:hypothetical protein